MYNSPLEQLEILVFFLYLKHSIAILSPVVEFFPAGVFIAFLLFFCFLTLGLGSFLGYGRPSLCKGVDIIYFVISTNVSAHQSKRYRVDSLKVFLTYKPGDKAIALNAFLNRFYPGHSSSIKVYLRYAFPSQIVDQLKNPSLLLLNRKFFGPLTPSTKDVGVFTGTLVLCSEPLPYPAECVIESRYLSEHEFQALIAYVDSVIG